jgi:hypothetical protein
MEENIYGSKEAADLVQVQESTLRKYALILEEVGYHFHKNSSGQRGFYDRDIVALRRMLEINKNPDMTLKRAAHAVVSTMVQVVETVSDMTDISLQEQFMKRYIVDMSELKEVIHNQNELIRGLMDRLEEESTARKEMERTLLHRIEEGPKEKSRIIDQDALKETEKRIMERLDKLEREQEEAINLFEEESAAKPSLWKRLFK